jgi:hypothetical protein
MKKRVVFCAWIGVWAAFAGCTSSGGSPTVLCANLDACCASVPTELQASCRAIVSGGSDATCASQLVTYQSTGLCGASSGPPAECVSLRACCAAMPSGAVQSVCEQIAAAGNGSVCGSELVTDQSNGACKASGTGPGSGTGSTTRGSSSTATRSSTGSESGTGTGSSSGILLHDAGFNDAAIPVDAPACLADAGPAGPGPLQHTGIIFPGPTDDDDNECDGHHDPASPFPANGATGNGFDDNCNGLVDEGCLCVGVGTTKPCYLVPASQTENGLPVGWCATNSKGTVNCQQQGDAPPTWSGTCRGAQPPYAEDVCAAGDFDCDGKAENPLGESCACKTSVITCPTAAFTTVPYPPPGALPLPINAGAWFSNASAVADATDWQWTLTGGDCDNILPNPTFGLYPTANGTGNPVGTTSTTLGIGGNEHGTVAMSPAVASEVYPAFSLSGDYVLSASWRLDGQPYTCSVQIAVRAPGLRAEGCWDTVGLNDDLDLHMAKVDGFTQCATSHAWSNLDCTTANEDCYYGDCYAGGALGGTDTTDWGFASSAPSNCTGWGSQTAAASCGNPRLDRDTNGLSGACDPTVVNPAGSSAVGPFCGPENINLDAPADGDQYAVAMRFYGRNGTASANVHGHVNVYCDGERILSAGYDPVAGINYPQLATPGADDSGDMWKVALVTTTLMGTTLRCTVAPTQSTAANTTLDGTTAYCVDDSTLNGAAAEEYLTSGGGVPASANALCFH